MLRRCRCRKCVLIDSLRVRDVTFASMIGQTTTHYRVFEKLGGAVMGMA
jgi:hypothetical protein